MLSWNVVWSFRHLEDWYELFSYIQCYHSFLNWIRKFIWMPSIISHLLLPFTDKPSAPQNLQVTNVQRDSIAISWQPPTDDGGAKITGYTVERRDAMKTSWTNAGRVDAETLNLKVSKLWRATITWSECSWKIRSELVQLLKRTSISLPRVHLVSTVVKSSSSFLSL